MSESKADKLIELLDRQVKRLDQMQLVLDGFSREVRTMHLELHEVRNEVEWDEATPRTERRATA